MNNITIITSVINTPNKPLSYTNIRSVFTREERYEQLKNTIHSVREKIPNNKIILVECSLLFDIENEYLKENTDFFLNIYDTNKQFLINRIFTESKSMGESIMTFYALLYLLNNNIEFDNLFKISGRYWINNNFCYDLFNNNMCCVSLINNDMNNIHTSFYKITKEYSNQFIQYLINSENDFINCIGYEVFFAKFINSIENKNNIKILEQKIGINGYISVCGTLLDI